MIEAKEDHPKAGDPLSPIKITVETEAPVELEGESLHALTLISAGAQIRNRWSSPSLSWVPSESFSSQEHQYRILPGAELRTQAFRFTSQHLIHEGKVFSPESLEIDLQGNAHFHNGGVVQAEGTIKLLGKQDENHQFIHRARFLNFGSLIAPKIVIGSLFNRFFTFENGDPYGVSQKVALIQTKQLIVDVHLFLNVASIQAPEKISLIGFNLHNRKGKIHSGGVFKASFDIIDNSEGALSGNTKTELSIWEHWRNEGGEVGSVSPTEFRFNPDARRHVLGKIQGTELTLSSNSEKPITLKDGTLIGQKSICMDSKAKVQMPGVQIQTPLLNLSVPDFALDEQKQCPQTVVHCNPSEGFTLTSPFCTNGKVAFLESCFKRSAFSLDEEARIKSPAQALKKTWKKLKTEIQKTSVYFKPEAGRVSEYTISLHAPLKASEEVEFIAPLSRIYLGDRPQKELEGGREDSEETTQEIGIEAKSLRAWANFLFVVDGFVAARDAFIHTPNGLEIGQLVKHPTDRVQTWNVQVLNSLEESMGMRRGVQDFGEFPLLCRNGATWVTQNQTYVNGPLRCKGVMDVGELIVNSEKVQWWRSPDLNVRGNLRLLGAGPIHVLRDVGEMWQSQDTVLSSTDYAVPGKVWIGKSLISEKPVAIKLYSTFFHADQIEGDVSFERIGTTGNHSVQFPGEKTERFFHPSLSFSKSAALQLKGKTSEGILAVPEVFITEHKSGQVILATRNPYFFNPKNPIQDLMEKEFPKNTVYLTKDLKEALEKEGERRFHFTLKERFFFDQLKSEQFYNQIKDDIVILHPSKGLMPLPEGPAVFSLSPDLLLKRVQEAAQENLMRGYLEKGQTISLEYLVQLHRNATDYLKKIGVSFAPSQK